MKNEDLLKMLEAETFLYALAHSQGTVIEFINKILSYLKKNSQLLENQNYKKLYDECNLLSQWLYTCEKNVQAPQDLIENFSCDKKVVENYLLFRMDSWSTGYYDSLFE